MYLRGLGVPLDFKEAAKWYMKAADQDIPAAEYNLAIMYEEGQGVAQDNSEAFNWCTKAAEGGDADAQNELAGMYEDGVGVAQELVRAHMWYTLATTSKSVQEDASKSLARIAGRMTAQQLTQAQEMARRCLASQYKDCK